MLTSLKVVSIAVLRVASSRRSATRARSRVIGTRRSVRCSGARAINAAIGVEGATTGASAEAAATGAGATMAAGWGCCRWATTSSLVMRPPLPLPVSAPGSSPCSATSWRAAGLSGTSATTASAAGAVAAVSPSATAPAVKRAITSRLCTVSPSSFRISLSEPSCGAMTSSTTLSVSMSASTSSRLQASPGRLCQLATAPSAMDSGNCGALISIAIVRFPLEIRIRGLASAAPACPAHHAAACPAARDAVPRSRRRAKPKPHGPRIPGRGHDCARG